MEDPHGISHCASPSARLYNIHWSSPSAFCRFFVSESYTDASIVTASTWEGGGGYEGWPCKGVGGGGWGSYPWRMSSGGFGICQSENQTEGSFRICRECKNVVEPSRKLWVSRQRTVERLLLLESLGWQLCRNNLTGRTYVALSCTEHAGKPGRPSENLN